MVFSGSFSDLIQIQKAGREKRPASRGYEILQMVKTEKRLEYCSTKVHFSGIDLSFGESAMI
jgi:hypothetical protein